MFEERALEVANGQEWLAPRGAGEFEPLLADVAMVGRGISVDTRWWFDRYGATPLAHTYGPLGYSPASCREALEWRLAMRSVGDVSSTYVSEAFAPVFVSGHGDVVLVHLPLASFGEGLRSWVFFKELQNSRLSSLNNFARAVALVGIPIIERLPQAML